MLNKFSNCNSIASIDKNKLLKNFTLNPSINKNILPQQNNLSASWTSQTVKIADLLNTALLTDGTATAQPSQNNISLLQSSMFFDVNNNNGSVANLRNTGNTNVQNIANNIGTYNNQSYTEMLGNYLNAANPNANNPFSITWQNALPVNVENDVTVTNDSENCLYVQTALDNPLEVVGA